MNNEQKEQKDKGIKNIKKRFYFLTIVFFFFCIVNILYICRKFLLTLKKTDKIEVIKRV